MQNLVVGDGFTAPRSVLKQSKLDYQRIADLELTFQDGIPPCKIFRTYQQGRACVQVGRAALPNTPPSKDYNFVGLATQRMFEVVQAGIPCFGESGFYQGDVWFEDLVYDAHHVFAILKTLPIKDYVVRQRKWYRHAFDYRKQIDRLAELAKRRPDDVRKLGTEIEIAERVRFRRWL